MFNQRCETSQIIFGHTENLSTVLIFLMEDVNFMLNQVVVGKNNERKETVEKNCFPKQFLKFNIQDKRGFKTLWIDRLKNVYHFRLKYTQLENYANK